MVPLRYPLRNGDTVDIITSTSEKPSKDWLKFVVTSSAQTKIRHHLRNEQRERSRRLGHDLLARELRNHHRSLATAEKERLLDKAAAALRLSSADDLHRSRGLRQNRHPSKPTPPSIPRPSLWTRLPKTSRPRSRMRSAGARPAAPLIEDCNRLAGKPDCHRPWEGQTKRAGNKTGPDPSGQDSPPKTTRQQHRSR